MNALPDWDHYEVLEASRDATPQEIERCYRLALATYADESLAGYSVFSEGDVAALRERIETAYRVLSDPERRRDYDASLGLPAEPAPEPEPVAAPPPPEPPLPEEDIGELDDGRGDFDGERLRRYRLRCGVELEEMAGTTKVNPTYLRFIEEEKFADLPAPVYVRGFVNAYAAHLGLDGKRVAASYMRRYESDRAARRSPRTR